MTTREPYPGEIDKQMTSEELASLRSQLSVCQRELDARPTKLAYDCVKSVCDRIGRLLGVEDDPSRCSGDDLVKAVSDAQQQLQQMKEALRECDKFAGYIRANLFERQTDWARESHKQAQRISDAARAMQQGRGIAR